MSWPLPDEINEAIQTLSLSFADPDLKGGQPVLGASGFPLPRSGNFADVYQVVGADGREWAVKCFTRPATGLDKRYDKVAAALAATPLPFAVEFAFLKEGFRVGEQWYPVVKMAWVEGLQLNQFVRENASRPAVLDSLLALWVKLTQRLRDAGIAHADIQHGNVMLVSGAKAGTLGLKLLDYDGMYVPALANQPSGERGHSAFQHPDRSASNIYSPDLDRFPHLVVATALKGLAVLGKALWERFDTGDNLLFTEADFKNPAGSKLLRELWQSGTPAVRSLAGRLAIACRKPITQTPWLDQIAPDGHPTPLTSDEERDASAALGLATAARPVTATPTPAKAVAASVAPYPKAPLDFADEEDVSERPPARPISRMPLILAAVACVGFLGLAAVIAAVYVFVLHSSDTVTQVTSFPTVPLPSSPPVMSQSQPPQPQTQTAPTPKTATAPTLVADPKLPTTAPPTPVTPSSFQKEVVRDLPPVPADARVFPVTWSVVASNTQVVHGITAIYTTDGKHVVATRPTSSEVVVLDAATGDVVREIKTSSPPMGLAALADGTVAVQLTRQNRTTVYKPETGEEVRTVATANYDYYERESPFLNGDRYVASADGSHLGGWRPVDDPVRSKANFSQEPGILTIFHAETGKRVVDTLMSRGRFGFSTRGDRLVYVESQGRLRLFDLVNAAPREVKFAGETGGTVRGLSPDATQFLYYGTLPGEASRGVHLMDARTGQLAVTLPREYTSSIGSAALALNGAVVAIQSPRRDGVTQLDLLDGRTGKLMGVVPLNDNVSDASAMTFSPDGRWLLLARGVKNRIQAIKLPFEVVAVAPNQPAPPTQRPPKNPPVRPKTPEVVGKRLAVPADTAVAQAETDLREVYKAEFAKKTAADKKSLANQLLDLAGKTPDDATARYAMLKLGRDLAVETLDGALAMRAIDDMGRYYDVPAADQKVAALDKILAATTQQAAQRELAELAHTAAEAAASQDSYDSAVKLMQVAASAARRGVLVGADEFDARVAALKKLRDTFAADVKAALATLATTPNDPAANQVVGKFRCYHQGRWADGVKHLTRSGSLILKTAADAEEEADPAKAGDAWWDIARIATDPVEKKQADARARMWYLQALPKMTGLALARAQTRLTVTVGGITYAPGLVTEFTSSSSETFNGVKGRIDTAIAFEGREFSPSKGGVLPTISLRWTGVIIAPKPGKYKLFVTTQDAAWDHVQVSVNKTAVVTSTKKTASTPGKYEAVVTLTDKPTTLTIVFNGYPSSGSGVKLLWTPITALGEGDPVTFAEYLFHDKKAESVLK